MRCGPRRFRRTVTRMNRLPVLAVGVALLGLLVGGLWAPPASIPSASAKPLDDLMMDMNIAPLDPQTPPPFSVTTLDGRRVTLADVKGQAALVYFWATW